MSIAFTTDSATRNEKELALKEKRKAVAGGKVKFWNIPRGWLHQGFFYLDRTQQISRVILEVVPTALIAYAIAKLTNISLSNFWLWVNSLLITHTLNWIFNCNWWAGMLFTFPNLKNPGQQATCEYLNSMAGRLKKNNSISAVMIFGSVSRGQWHDRSDLDMRLLRRLGLFNGIAGVLVLLRERLFALAARQPLDIYLADDITFLKKMRQDERPIFLKKEDLRLDIAYPESKETCYVTLKRTHSESTLD